MRSVFRICLAALAAVLAAGVSGLARAEAEASHSGDLLAVRLIGGISEIEESSVSGGGALTTKSDGDEVGAVAVALGYDWSKKGLPFRSEIEYAYRFRFDYGLRVRGGTDSDFEVNVATHSVMAHFYYDIETGTSFTPYVGFGLGWARHIGDSEQTKLSGGAKQDRDGTTDNFAWSANAGVLYRLGSDWNLEAAYRYASLGDVESGRFSDGAIVTGEDYTSHDVVLSVLYRF